MFVADMPNVPDQYQPVIVAEMRAEQSSRAPVSAYSALPEQKYDAAFSVCSPMQPAESLDRALVNVLRPLSIAAIHLFNKYGIVVDSGEASKVTLLEGPSHGKLIPDPKFPSSSFLYQPETAFIGSDQMVFVIELRGKVFKIIQSVYVSGSPPEAGCPANFKLPPEKVSTDH